MKDFLFLTIVVVAMISAVYAMPKSRREICHMQASCLSHAKLKEEVIRRAKLSEYPQIEVMPIILCFYRVVDWWSDSKGFEVENIMQGLDKVANERHLNKQRLRETILNCLDEKRQEETLLEWAYRSHKCFMDHKYLWLPFSYAKFTLGRDANDK